MDALQSAAISASGNLDYSMSITAPFYRHAIIRAVTGNRPAIVWNRICERLAEAERALEILRAKGHGRPGLLLHEVAALVPGVSEQ
jgi:hypothetical protein